MGKKLTARWLGHYLGYRPMGIEACSAMEVQSGPAMVRDQ